MLRKSRTACVLLSLLVLGACGPASGAEDQLGATRDTLSSGVVVVSYGPLPDSGALSVGVELRIGALDGDPNFVFGDVRGVEADSDGAIYVLDFQAAEIRKFDADGSFQATLGGKGEGPGELSEANGMILIGDSLFWIQDHGKWQMLEFRKDGTEVARIPMPVRGYGYIWDGSVDEEGRIWKRAYVSDAPFTRPEPGLQESSSEAYWVSFNPGTQTQDSVYMGVRLSRMYVTHSGSNGVRMMAIPHQPSSLTIVDPAGGFWRSDADEYTLIRLNQEGDTVLIIQAEIPAPQITDQERDDVRLRILERDETLARAAEEIVAAMPQTKSAISGLLIDDEGQLWVRRGGTEEDFPHYDIFSRDGDYRGALRLDFTPSQWLPLKVRRGKIYAVVLDDLEVPFVIRASLPD